MSKAKTPAQLVGWVVDFDNAETINAMIFGKWNWFNFICNIFFCVLM